jgi:hypothetical protein
MTTWICRPSTLGEQRAIGWLHVLCDAWKISNNSRFIRNQKTEWVYWSLILAEKWRKGWTTIDGQAPN